MIEELLAHTSEYLTPVTITKATLNKWIGECILECVEWEAELLTEEKDFGSKKSGQVLRGKSSLQASLRLVP